MRDSFVPIEGHTVTWKEHGGQRYHVQVMRCLGCGAREGVQREVDRKHAEAHKNLKPGQASPKDGIRLAVEPISEGE